MTNIDFLTLDSGSGWHKECHPHVGGNEVLLVGVFLGLLGVAGVQQQGD